MKTTTLISTRPTNPYPILEWITTFVLMFVLAALAWMAATEALPEAWRLPALESEVVGVLGLLTAALLLVSVLALLLTKDGTTQNERRGLSPPRPLGER